MTFVLALKIYATYVICMFAIGMFMDFVLHTNFPGYILAYFGLAPAPFLMLCAIWVMM